MKKLILTSNGVPKSVGRQLTKLIGKNLKDIKVLFIANASDSYSTRNRWAFKAKESFLNWGVDIEELDLHDYVGKQEGLKLKLLNCDLVWVGPGDTAPLINLMKKTGFDQIIDELLDSGIAYGGESAGAIVAGPGLKEEKGLNLVEFLPIPHWDDPKKTEEIKKIIEEAKKLNHEIVPITEDEAVVVEDHAWRKIH